MEKIVSLFKTQRNLSIYREEREKKKLGNIGLSILIIGLINIYNIVKEGIIFNLPTSITIDKIISKNIGLEILKIDINSIKIIIFITIILYIIFNLEANKLYFNITTTTQSNFGIKVSLPVKNSSHISRCEMITGAEKRETLEYKLLIGLGIIGLILMMLSKELIILYLGLELYSFTIYILILVKESIIIRKISIIYLILSSLASGLLLYTFALIYNKYGVLDIDTLKIITNILNSSISTDISIDIWGEKNIILYLILIALLFKLGAIPFSYWLIRVYADLDKRILWYQLTIPKLVFFILLIKFINIFNTNYSNFFIYLLFIVSILSLIVGSIGGLFQNKDNLLLSYSSVLNIGYILLSLTFLLTLRPSIQDLSNITSPFNNIDNFSNLWILYHFFIVYILNLLALFAIILLYYQSSLVFNLRTFYSNPFFFISFLIIIFSFIGLPPFSGFFGKFYLIFTLFFSSTNYSTISFLSILSFLLFSFISSFFYFKFLFSSSSSPISLSSTSGNTPLTPLTPLLIGEGVKVLKNTEKTEKKDEKDLSLQEERKGLNIYSVTNIISTNSNASLVLSFIILITITYPFLISYIIPLLQEIYSL